MHTIANYALLVFGAFAAVAMAAPAQAKQSHGVQYRATTDVANEDASATCVYGVPASSSIDYAAVAALGTRRSYDIDDSFTSTHAVGSAMDLYMSPGSEPNDYASFKCQFTCNVGGPDADGCFLFVSLDEGAFTSESKNIANGGFNKLCD
ncbi:hypothetical protein SLS53_000373 [Cytospora paraplurivora]|uniref:AA1-like domain-containing protein n=1 Tax=Cytospora paraplurivora TaxID=2898453 RepID=A0AAN9YPV1_9PEZI